jgi:hypothetical protein
MLLASAALGSGCQRETWTLEPEPSGKVLRALSGTGPQDAWAAGDSGTLLHYVGGWRVHQAPTRANLLSVWAVTPNDAWAVGGAVVRWNGTQWSAVEAPIQGYAAVWASGPTDVWLAGNETLERWNGTEFKTVDLPGHTEALALAGSGPDDVWLANARGEAYHFNGREWTRTHVTDPSLAFRFAGFFVVGPKDVWGYGGSRWGLSTLPVQRWDGTQWNTVHCPVRARKRGAQVVGVWGSRSNSVWLIDSVGGVHHWNGKTCESTSYVPPAPLVAIWGWGGDDFLALGGETLFKHQIHKR